MKTGRVLGNSRYLNKVLLCAFTGCLVLFTAYSLNGNIMVNTSSGIWFQLVPDQERIGHPRHLGGLLVNSSSCMIPDYDPWDRSLAPVLDKEKPFKGCRQDFAVRIEQDGNKLILIRNHSNAEPACSIECCYRNLTRASEGRSDDEYSLSDERICFNGSSEVQVASEFVQVLCFCLRDPATVVHEDYRVFFVPREGNKPPVSGGTSKKGEEQQLSVYIFGLDSISRLNFRRTLPRIERILREDFDAFEMLGFTKVGLNTFPNMMVLLSGRSVDQMNQSLRSTPFDKQPFIWKQFKALGYTTMFNEDLAEISTFNYIKKGFFHQPTDYYLRPVNIAMEKSELLKTRRTLCINQRIELELQLDWLQQLMSMPASHPQFALMYNSALSHEGPLKYVNYMQPYLERFFHWYRHSPRYNSSIMVFFSDHGQRFGEVMRYELGGFESRTPYMYLLLPPWYAARYPQRVSNLRQNARRLTTFYDVHATLRQMVADAGGVSLPWMDGSGISLFQAVPAERSCKQAGIAEHWCVCKSRSPVSVHSEAVRRAAQAAVQHINQVKLQHVVSQCASLQLKRITNAMQQNQKTLKEKDTAYTRRAFEEYVVEFVTLPGLAEFESTVRAYSGEPELTVLEVSRLNVYKGQSDCLKDRYDERRFCFCKS